MSSLETISVSEYLDRINLTLKKEKAKIVGEVSGAHLHPSGHLYFSLLDKADKSKIECMMWKSNYKMAGVEVKDGVEIVATVTPDIYKPWGRFAAKVEMIELVGEGALKIAYEKLRGKLELEGLFLDSRKREIPEFPKRIGVITSKSGAVINDFLTNIGKFGFELLFVDSKVEGQEALTDLLSAVETLKNKEIDVLVLMRGGGSLESFMAFNNENLVRAIADFPVPVLTGIGHDKDAPLVSMVSDKNVSTPTAVANLLNSSWSSALSSVRLSEEIIISRFQSVLVNSRSLIENSVIHMGSGIKNVSDNIDSYKVDILRGFESISQNIENFLSQSAKILSLSDPKRQLALGFSIVKSKGRILKSVKNVSKGDELTTMLSDGVIESKII